MTGLVFVEANLWCLVEGGRVMGGGTRLVEALPSFPTDVIEFVREPLPPLASLATWITGVFKIPLGSEGQPAMFRSLMEGFGSSGGKGGFIIT